ncbi:MAG TPA: peptidase T [Anaerolineaceae bacterium]|nr:peptidase T [Anaerolineaceae bacterium]
MTTVKDRFLKYARIKTTSDPDSETSPSSAVQFDLARVLEAELREMGMEDVELDRNCYLMATLPANTGKPLPTIGFIAHMDTSPDMSGENVNPQIISNYDGGEIVLNPALNVRMSPDEFPELKKYVGQELITTDGTTLLGADDKAGVAVILSAMAYLFDHPEIKHGKIRVGFTPDEEVGRGANLFDVAKFAAEYAYTVDGGEIGELEYETFNAAQAIVTINGRNVHPGAAKNKMINSILLAMEFNAMLPVNERPEFTEGREGFVHLMSVKGTVESTKLVYIIRDHDRSVLEKRKQYMQDAAAYLNRRLGKTIVELEIKDQYYNMREKIEPVYHIVEDARQAMLSLGIQPVIVPVRGGTDGSRLSYMGLPTPNLFTGGMYYHGKYEILPVRSLELAVDVVVRLIEIVSNK